MRVDLFPSGTWDEVNAEAAQALAPAVSEGDFEARCYRGLVPALLEVFTGTASFLSHRRNLGVVAGRSWAEQPLLAHLLRESFQIKSFSVEDLREPEKCLDALEGESSCVVWPEDHPVTGELYDGSALEEALAKKRIFSIRLSHSAYRTRPVALSPYAVRVCSVAPDLAVALGGARFKTPVWTARWESWRAGEAREKIGRALDGAREDRALVQAFESGLGPAWKTVLTGESRLWDRSVLFNAGKSGEAVMTDLSRILSTPMGPAGGTNWGETLHLCRWNSIMKDLDWWKPRPSADAVRGMVVLDLDLLGRPEVREYFR